MIIIKFSVLKLKLLLLRPKKLLLINARIMRPLVATMRSLVSQQLIKYVKKKLGKNHKNLSIIKILVAVVDWLFISSLGNEFLAFFLLLFNDFFLI